MSISAIQGLAGQAAMRAATGPASAAPHESMSFAAAMHGAVNDAALAVRQGEAAAAGAITGSVPVDEAVSRIMEAERTFQAALAVRDKIVAAWMDLSRMQI